MKDFSMMCFYCENRILIVNQDHICLIIEHLTFSNMFAHRSSRPEVFCKKGVFKKFAKFTGKHLRRSLFSGKVAGRQLYYEKDSGTGAAKFLRTPIS